LYFSNPKVEMVGKVPIGCRKNLFANLFRQRRRGTCAYPVYQRVEASRPTGLYHNIERHFPKMGVLDKMVDPIPAEILPKVSPTQSQRPPLFLFHRPKKKHTDALAGTKKFCLLKKFFHQVKLNKRTLPVGKKEKPFAVTADKKSVMVLCLDSLSRPQMPWQEKKYRPPILSYSSSGHPACEISRGRCGFR